MMTKFLRENQSIIENKIRELLISHSKSFLTKNFSESTRAVGDGLQNLIANQFYILFSEIIKNYDSKYKRRSIPDFSFCDEENNFYAVDVKTHRENTGFNMPNLISVERIIRFYEKESNYFMLLIINYEVKNELKLDIGNVHFIPIEQLSWSCLTIGALGWGQIQIKDSKKIIIDINQTRKDWLLMLIDKLLYEFYPEEINKIKRRINYFEEIKKTWIR